ncbi:MAG: T9SS type A sorting domain-containing protein [Vicingaceae bacterium]
MKHLSLLSLLLFAAFYQLRATHNKGGVIEYQHQSGNSYEIEVKLYQDPQSPGFQRNTIEIRYGDNSGLDSISRSSVVQITNDLVVVSYTTIHTYNGAGQYHISVEEPNRSAGTDNINNSVNVPLYLSAYLEIDPLGAIRNNSSSVQQCPVSFINLNQKLTLNMTAFDADGDSLTYELVNAKGTAGANAPAYFIPNGIQLDPLSGKLDWTPQGFAGTYVLAVEIKEYRDRYLVGRTTVDFIIVVNPLNGGFYLEPLELLMPSLQNDSCGYFSLRARDGDTLNIRVKATDTSNASPNPSIELEALTAGGPPNAITSIPFRDSSQTSKTIELQYVIDGNDARCAPYPIYFRGVSEGTSVQNLELFLFVMDSTSRTCDSLCSFVGLPSNQSNTKVELKIGPNPMTAYTKIEVLSKVTSNRLEFELYTVSGKRLRHRLFNPKEELILKRKNLPSGCYFFRILNQEKAAIAEGKILIQ